MQPETWPTISPFDNALRRSAVLSRDGRYRYALRRVWDDRGRAVLFVGLNPSTADHRVDDPTIRRCMTFARDWGFGQLLVANLFAFRTSSPARLFRAADPIGRRNDHWIRRLAADAHLTIAAWGNHGELHGRGADVLAALTAPHCLTVNKSGHPKHPLYVQESAWPRPFAACAPPEGNSL